MTRTDIINRLIKERGYRTYLEVGVENPSNNYDLVTARYKESVDNYEDNRYLSEAEAEQYANVVTYRMTSDEFFAKTHKTYDIIFIDAMHTEEQCDRDIWNAMQHLNAYGCVVVHDVLPASKEMQSDKPEPGRPWQGTVWKSIRKLIRMGLPVNVLDYDYGVAVIEKCQYPMPAVDNGVTYDNYNKSEMNIRYTTDSWYNVISYFTPLYHTTREMVMRAYKSLYRQTDRKWEWVLLADSTLEQDVITAIKTIEAMDPRVHYWTMKPNSCETVGEAKYRASMLCRGYLVAELDHDDVLMPRMTEYLRKAAAKYPDDGFFYCDTIEVDSNFKSTPRYPDGFGMGYGRYYTLKETNPITGIEQEFDVIRQMDINPATMRHIVGVPNHIRCWRRYLLMGIGGYNRSLPIADDYELLIRTFLSTKMCRINYAGYMQIMHGDNTQDKTRPEIQEYVHAIANAYHHLIAYRFEKCGVHDWLHERQPDSADNCWRLSDGSIEDYYNDVFDIHD